VAVLEHAAGADADKAYEVVDNVLRARPWPGQLALAAVELPLHLNWSAPGRVFDLRSRADRARVYEIVLQEGRPADILAYVDGALLVDRWDDLVLPRAVRSAWVRVTGGRLPSGEVAWAQTKRGAGRLAGRPAAG